MDLVKPVSTLNVPTLLLTGSESASPQLKQAISGLLDSLPNRRLFVFEGVSHQRESDIEGIVTHDARQLDSTYRAIGWTPARASRR